MQTSEPQVIQKHYRDLSSLQRQHDVIDANIYNMDEKGFRQGIADRARVICRHLPRGMSGKVAIDGNRELITVVETVCGDGFVLPPLVIYKGAAHYMGWYQYLNEKACIQWKFTYSKSG